jgi:predicted glutamine amidotransferase
MCRLFGMSGGPERVRATFWLLDAPDSLARQSRREPDGTGLGYYRDGRPVVEKRPLAAYEDREFARRAREVSSRTFIAHVRYASTGGLSPENTHPFELAGRLFAHNGVIEGLDQLERELGKDISLVRGDTDSERFFVLLTREIERTGAVGEGISSAVHWVAEHLPVFALNFVLVTEDELWALRYPDVHDLLVLERPAGGTAGARHRTGGARHLNHASARGTIRVSSAQAAATAVVVVASEAMDDDPAWRRLAPGELVHVDRRLSVSATIVIDRPPAHQLTLADLREDAAASQREPAPIGGR